MDTGLAFGIEAVVVILLLAVWGIWSLMRAASENRQSEASFARATPSTATITAIRHTHIGRGAAVSAELTLRLASEDNDPVDVAWAIESTAMPRIQVGTVVKVKVDPNNPQNVFPNEAWAH